jgi:hypothetical protein
VNENEDEDEDEDEYEDRNSRAVRIGFGNQLPRDGIGLS